MNNETTKPRMSTERKAELFEKIMLSLTDFIPIRSAVGIFDGSCAVEDLVSSDYSDTLNPIFKLMTHEELRESLRKIIPRLLETDLGAKRVTIKW